MFHVDLLAGEVADDFQEVVLVERVVVGGDEVGDLLGGGGAADGIAEFIVGHEADTEGFCEFNGHGKSLSDGR